MKPIQAHEYEAFRNFLEKESGIILGDNKHYLVTSRLSRMLSNLDIADLTELLNKLKIDIRLREKTVDAMTTNETSWFRDQHPYIALNDFIFPELIRRQEKLIRIWSSACSTGQEPYSISMCFEESTQAHKTILKPQLEIIATDIAPSALEEAKLGRYEELSLGRGLSKERRQRFFNHNGDYGEVKEEIKKRVKFRGINLMQNYSSLGNFDVIFCRNVLIYFSTDFKKEVLSKMARILKPGGFLLLGGSESMANYSNAFEMLRVGPTVVYQLKK